MHMVLLLLVPASASTPADVAMLSSLWVIGQESWKIRDDRNYHRRRKDHSRAWGVGSFQRDFLVRLVRKGLGVRLHSIGGLMN